MKLKTNLKKLIIKLGIFFLVFILIRFLINSFFHNFKIYELLVIPRIFKPIFSGMIARVAIILVIAFVIINKEKLLNLGIKKTRLKEIVSFGLLTLFIVIFYYLLRFFIRSNLQFATKYIWFFIPLLYFFILVFGFSLFITVFGVQVIKDIYKNFRKQLKYFAIAGIIVYFLLIWVQSLWMYFSKGVATVLQFIFSLFYENVDMVYKPTGPILKVEGFSATIGAPCSGVDSLLMFAELLLLLFLLDRKRLNKKLMFILFPIGLLGTYAFNILRIFLLYLTGVYLSPEFAVGLFHQNIGWILFIAYFFVFWYIASKYVYKKEVKKNI